METSLLPPGPSKGWPPERGWPLFLAWMGGIVVVALIHTAMTIARIGISSFPVGWNDRVLSILPALAGCAWQAWLLFRKHPVRFGLWTALPLLWLIPIPANPVRFLGFLSVVIPLFEAAILRNIRQRAWAWILASMASVLLSSLFTYFAYGAGLPLMTKVTSELGSHLGPFAGLVQFGILRGIWLLGEALCAAVLAWKMPPATSTQSQPQNSA
jgi:hypothetical protein